MIPTTGAALNTTLNKFKTMPSLTYDVMGGLSVVDRLDAMRQAIYLILSIERYRYPVYSWNYGIELEDLIGQPIPYVMSEVKTRITEALNQDDRITDVSGWGFESSGNSLLVRFTVSTVFGSFETEMGVPV